MKDAQPSAIFLQDYKAPSFIISRTELSFELFEDHALVHSQLHMQRDAGAAGPLVLDGQDLELVSVAVNDVPLTSAQYTVDAESLSIADLPDTFVLSCTTRIKPQENTALEGLYRSQKMFCTQCEAEGFRRITYYLDRPDVMSEFFTEIVADKAKYPVLLSNGNLIEQNELPDNRHQVKWHDPHKKPCYLFALVAGDLVSLDDTFTTVSGRSVVLRIFVEQKDIHKCDYAMAALKKSMKWDEEVYGREYDLDIFMIVAVDDFNMGAMENKGLNIFNSSCVLANQASTTDDNFLSVEAIVAHEYFHNWSGNRVTCRDWFQLSLKEGFTVFRDAEFSADMNSRTVKRIEDVKVMRTNQFAEDSGPMAHPVQPPSYIEISNFYTLTVYEKGAEVVRMIHQLLGAEAFRKGSDLYFSRHDGQAVTINEFVAAMAEVSGRDFSQFMNWYQQAGTPEVALKGEYDPSAQTYKLTVKQHCRPTPECSDKKPYLIPLAMGLLGANGSMPLYFGDELDAEKPTHRVLEVTEAEQQFLFTQVAEEPVPSLFRNFSAPVKYQYNYSLDDLQRIITLDEDGFCRWDASQQMAISVIHRVLAEMAESPAPTVDSRIIDAHSALLDEAISAVTGNTEADLHLLAYMLSLPSEGYLAELKTPIDVEGIHFARNRVKRKLAAALKEKYRTLYVKLADATTEFSVDAAAIARRYLKNLCLDALVFAADEAGVELCKAQLHHANNMTDELSALRILVHNTNPFIGDVTPYLEAFYQKWKADSLVMNKWLAVQASRPAADALASVSSLLKHPAFDKNNPNKLRAVLGTFANGNPIGFHARSGAGYEFFADQVIAVDARNPQIAARLVAPLTQWKKHDEQRQGVMRNALEKISRVEKLSKDVYEIVSKSL
ncbi:aminopeptidase N [Teredinibacter turnerae]|uniref:aminopeptidase N n=1 Tax=Teredinibacter turnerae TaxID=2426 RepID=UPI0003FB6A26|nr:aminopeptidase N [Teredinibacter turnerae]